MHPTSGAPAGTNNPDGRLAGDPDPAAAEPLGAAAPVPASGADPVAATGFLPGIEILRGVAASAVVAEHTWALTTSPRFPGSWVIEGFGEWGVVLFFLISGYILCDGFWRPTPVTARTFWVRRVFRIAPAYYVNVGLLFLFFASSRQLLSSQGVKQVVANATFTHWLFPNQASSLNVNGALWTLTIEMCLYLMLPLMAPPMRRRPFATFAVLFGIGLAYRVWITFDGAWLERRYFAGAPVGSANSRLFMERQFIGVLPLFAVGMLLRWLVLRWQRRAPATPRPLRVTVLLALLVPSVVLLRLVTRGTDFHHPFFFIGYEVALVITMVPVVVYASVWVDGNPRAPVRTALVWVGERSYSLYLWHFPIVLALFGRGPEVNPPDMAHSWVKVVLVAVLSLVAADVSYRAIERPARSFGRRLSRPPRPPRPAPAATRPISAAAAG